LAARPAAAARLLLFDDFRLVPRVAAFLVLLRAGAALRAPVVFFETAGFRDPARLRVDVALRVEPRLRALEPLAVDARFLRTEVLRLRALLLVFLPLFEPPRDDFLAAAMI
jgi:hypothetical protein